MGHSRKRAARASLVDQSPAHIKADQFIAAWLSDQIDARAGLKTFTLCDVALTPDGYFDFESAVSLRRSPEQHVVEYFGHKLALVMLEMLRWCVVYKVAFKPVPERYDQVQCTKSIGIQPCFTVPVSERQVERKPATDVGDIEELFDGFFESGPSIQAVPLHPPVGETDAMEEALDMFFEDDEKLDDASSSSDQALDSDSDGDEQTKKTKKKSIYIYIYIYIYIWRWGFG